MQVSLSGPQQWTVATNRPVHAKVFRYGVNRYMSRLYGGSASGMSSLRSCTLFFGVWTNFCLVAAESDLLDESGPIWSSLKWIVQLHKMSMETNLDSLTRTEQALLTSKRVRELQNKGMMNTEGLQNLLQSLRNQLLQGAGRFLRGLGAIRDRRAGWSLLCLNPPPTADRHGVRTQGDARLAEWTACYAWVVSAR